MRITPQILKSSATRLCLLLLGILLVAGCQGAPLGNFPLLAATAVRSTPLPTAVPSLPAPVVDTAAELTPATARLVFSDEPPTVTPIPTVSVEPRPSATPTALPATVVPADTPTPEPTFTPPALPETASWEHYWLWRPVPEGGTVWTDKTYPYGSTRGNTLRPHHGVEFNVPRDTPILASASGTVVVAGDDAVIPYGPQTDFYGRLVVIEHDFQYEGRAVYTLYGHLSSVEVVVGQEVAALTWLGLSGSSGIADGPHLHFEVRIGENSYDHTRNPLLWLYPFPERGTVAGLVIWPDGERAEAVPIRVRRIDAPSRYAATTTYSGTSVNHDEGWRENFVVDDIAAGYYEIVINTGTKEFKTTVWVYPRRTSFIEMIITP